METFLFVLLTILKILGIILAVLVGIVLLVLILILFVPVKYSGDGSFVDNKPDFKARSSYLLHIVTVSFDISLEDKLTIKIFGFKLGKKKKKSDDKVSEQDSKKEEVKICPEQEIISEEKISEETTSPAENTDIDESEEVKIEEIEKTGEAAGFLEEDKNPGKKKEKSTTEEGIYGRIKKYIEKLKKDEVKESLSLCKKQLGILLRSVLPKRWEINGSAGFEDPSTTGTLCMILGMIYPWTYKHLHVTGDFEKPEIKIYGSFKGRIFGIVLLVTALRVFFDKNVRKTVKLFKED